MGDPFFPAPGHGIPDRLPEGSFAHFGQDEPGTGGAPVFIVPVFHIHVPGIPQNVPGQVPGIHLGVNEHPEPAAVDSEAAAGIDIESAAGTGHKAQVLESGMAFIVDAVGKADLVFPGQFQFRNQADDEIGGCPDGRGHVKRLAFFHSVERAGGDVPGVVPAGSRTVDSLVEAVLVQAQYFLFLEMMELEGFPGGEMGQGNMVFVDGLGQEGHMGLVDGAAGEAQPEHAAARAPFSIGTEFAGSPFIFSGSQLFGIESPGGFLEDRELASDLLFGSFRNLRHGRIPPLCACEME